MDKKPILGITMGDPSGIGPEIIVKSLNNSYEYDVCRPLVIGDANVIKAAVELLEYNLVVNSIYNIDDAIFEYGTIDVYDLANVDIKALKYGEVSEMSGRAAYEYIEKVIELAKDKKVDSTVTAPINKESIKLAGCLYAGHTEIYAHHTGTRDYTMMLAEGSLRVVHVSTHVSLRDACDLVKKKRVLKTIELAHKACKNIGIDNPRIGVAGLNPHSGENGLFGWEEQREIIPAIEAARETGIDAIGPIPADTIFSKARGGVYDIVVAMYHDQGHIPLKVVGFQYDEAKKGWKTISGVNITLGLPIIRTSVDHGTAFEIAWQGIANEDSMLNAIDYGIKLYNAK